MEIPLVNEQDVVIGSKPREDLDYTHDIFRTASLWITNERGDILLAQRAWDKAVDPGKWAEAVGGTVEGNDSYEDTVIREAWEELGVRALHVTRGPKQFITEPARYFVQWYQATINQPIDAFSVQEEEVEQIAWIPVRQLQAELREQPEKYIEPMAEILHLFLPDER